MQVELIENMINEDILAFREKYTGMNSICKNESGIVIEGELSFSANFNDHNVQDKFQIRIAISQNYPEAPPKVWETLDRIPIEFHHFQDGSLCLGALIEVRRKFTLQRNLIGFTEQLLIPYLYQYSRYESDSEMPFGELSHGNKGISEYYKELFCVEEHAKVLGLLQILADESYRGHLPCPCLSGAKLRQCHGIELLSLRKYQTSEDFMFDYGRVLSDIPQHENPLPHIIRCKALDNYLKRSHAEKEKSSA